MSAAPALRRYFVTGTDTGVGKTFVTCALARRARSLGAIVFAFKPIETGVKPSDVAVAKGAIAKGAVAKAAVAEGNHLGEDQRALVAAAGSWQQGDARGIYQFALPAAPLVAARAEHAEIDPDRIKRTFLAHADAGLVLVEGAGGLRVPITHDVDMAGLARILDLPLIVVARATLGTINHTLLTVEAAERDGLKVAAIVLSRRPEEDLEFAQSNFHEIRQKTTSPTILFDGDSNQLAGLLG